MQHPQTKSSQKKFSLFGLVFLFALLQPGLVAAHKISFSVIETISVANDLLVIEFAAEHQAKTNAEVTQLVNKSMQNALQQLSSEQKNLVQTGNFSVYPRYDKNQNITHWQGQQNLTVKIPKDGDIEGILSKLQTELVYKSMRADVSKTSRQAAEEKLQAAAIMSYQAKAKTLSEQFGKPEGKLLETNILNLSSGYRPQAKMVMMAADSAPTIEMGEQELSLQINGTLQLK